MKKEILISSRDSGLLETRIAIVELSDGGKSARLTDYFVVRPDNRQIVGNIYKGRVSNILPGLNSAFINIGIGKNAYLQVDDVVPHNTRKIQSVLKPGMEVMVQVIKDSIGTKGPKVTMDVSVTGRFAVLMPFGEEKVGVSKNIEEKNKRAFLKNLVRKMLESKKVEYGIIVRTEAEDADEDEIIDEIKYLDKLWHVILNKYRNSSAPKLIYSDLDVVEQVIRDYFTDEVELLMADTEDTWRKAVEYAEVAAPDVVPKIKLYKNRTPIFSAFNIEKELSGLLNSKVKLPSGGYIIIQEAESLCAIDVNSGKFLGESLEDTVTRTNIEAAEEIARQLRLRNIGGIIVIDFIDMKNRSSRARVLEALKNAVKSDKAKIKIFPVTNLGLIEMSRSRKSSSLRAFLGDSCPSCGGSGMVLSSQTLFIRVAEELSSIYGWRHSDDSKNVKIKIKLHPASADYFLNNKDKLPAKQENISIIKDSSVPPGEYNIIVE